MTDFTQPKTLKQEIKERRERVIKLRREGKNESQIAEILNTSRETIVRDVRFIKNEANIWIEDLASHDFVFEYKESLEELKENKTELKKLYSEAEVPEKVKILKQLDENAERYIRLLGEAPAVFAFRKKVKKNVQAT